MKSLILSLLISGMSLAECPPGSLGWAVTDSAFKWNETKAQVKAFQQSHKCETKF